ncbi:hypothetical protein COW64_17330 [bacterium (Candidatus Blackallbacteria) CG18_big_fil_WC_8_21_14_2_50_49_26]|nr:MAG: hypothetical protein COW64_17330 [bacterium (Candidatus Blackallbacteria) CG18_big_fil_WC_8_21_14_2_50_49_26]
MALGIGSGTNSGGGEGGFSTGQALGLVGGLSSLLGGGLGIAGNLKEASGFNEQQKLRASIFRQNASLNQQTARSIRDIGKIQIRRQQRTTRQAIGSQRASLAASGILVDQGSAVDIIANTASVGKQSEIDIFINAEFQAFQQLVLASNAESDARLAEFVGKSRVKTAQAAIPGQIISGLGQAAITAAPFFL